MTVRALIIAVEDYPSASGLAPHLEGTNAAGDRFRDWLIETKFEGNDPGPDRLRYCGAAGRPGVTGGTTREAILDEMDALVKAGKDRTSELYLFFSGHGFAFEERRGRRLDVLLASNFVDLQRGGRATVLLGDLQEKAQIALGQGDHFYFVDACRNVIGPSKVTPLPVDNVWEPSLAGMGCVLTLYSTRSGARASTKSEFSEALVQGLGGAGKAKARLGAGRMAVTFDRLAGYVKSRVPEQEPTLANPQGCDGVIRLLTPAPRSRCHVRVEGAAADDLLSLVVSDPNGDFEDRVTAFVGATAEIELSPNEYGVQVVDPSGRFLFTRQEPAAEGPVDLWDSRELVFFREVGASSGVSPDDVLPTRLRVSFPRGTHLSLTRTDGGKVREGAKSANLFEGEVGPGDYEVQVLERGSVVARRAVTLRPGEEQDIDLRMPPASAVRDEILSATHNDPRGPLYEVSESLGPFAGAQLGQLLALLGASRIVERHGTFEKMGHLPLASFEDMLPGESALYVLAAFDGEAGGPSAPLRLSLSRPEGPAALHDARAVPGFSGLWDHREKAASGPHLLWFSRAGGQPVALATHLLPNRATLITLSDSEEDGELEIHQYLLPLYRCRSALRAEELSCFEEGPRRFTRFLWRAQNQFAAKRPIALEEQEQDFWRRVLQGDWLDPMATLLAAYELVRRGALQSPERALLEKAADNLASFFPGLPDTQVLLRLLGRPWTELRTAPLVRHGLLVWPRPAGAPPLPASGLIFEGLWSAWSHPDAAP